MNHPKDPQDWRKSTGPGKPRRPFQKTMNKIRPRFGHVFKVPAGMTPMDCDYSFEEMVSFGRYVRALTEVEFNEKTIHDHQMDWAEMYHSGGIN